jgi:hypothetical protein
MERTDLNQSPTSMQRGLQLKYNISTWPKSDINYWGIQKCGTTSVKYMLHYKNHYKRALFFDKVKNYNNYNWVHDAALTRYISKDEALTNGLQNITNIRDPYDRFLSMYTDICIRRKDTTFKDFSFRSIEDFLDYLELNINKSDKHMRTQSYYIVEDDKVIPKTIDIQRMDLMEKILGLKIPELNQTNNDIYLTDEQKDQVYHIFQQDFEVIKYDK